MIRGQTATMNKSTRNMAKAEQNNPKPTGMKYVKVTAVQSELTTAQHEDGNANISPAEMTSMANPDLEPLPANILAAKKNGGHDYSI